MRRRRGIVAQATVWIAVAATVLTLISPPVYEARARLLVEAPATNLNTVDASNPISELLALSQPQTVETQVEELQSPALLERVRKEVPGPIGDISVQQVGNTNVVEVMINAP